MTVFFQNLFSSIFGNNVILATILIAMVPIIELKGAIPFAMSVTIWNGYALNFISAFLWALLGSSLVVPLLVILYKPIINFFKNTKLFKKLALKIENKINFKKQNVEKKLNNNQQIKQNLLIPSMDNANGEDLSNNLCKEKIKIKSKKALFIKLVSVFIFVAIPLPFTGVWTGSCLAVALGLNFCLSCITVILGNIVCGILVTCFASFFSSPLTFLYIFLGLVIIFSIFYLIKKIICLKLIKKQKIKKL